MAESSRKGNAVFVQYTFFKHNDSIIIISFNNINDFSDNQKKEISDYIQELFKVNTNTFQFSENISSKYNVNVLIHKGSFNQEKTYSFLLSK